MAQYILDNEEKIRKEYKYSFCADEIFVHTLVYHSEFYKKVYDVDDEYRSVQRLTTWEDPRNQFHLDDVENILKSGMLFARKFDDEDAVKILNTIKLLRG